MYICVRIGTYYTYAKEYYPCLSLSLFFLHPLSDGVFCFISFFLRECVVTK